MQTKITQKRIDEIKYGVLYMAEQLGTEKQLRKVFDRFSASFPDAWKYSEQQIRTFLAKIAVSYGCFEELKNAMHYFDQLPKKRPSEQETRKNMLDYAVKMGVPKEQVLSVFKKYDNLLKKAADENERQHIAYMGAAELHKLFGAKGPLVMDGKLILPAEEGYEEENRPGTFIKID